MCYLLSNLLAKQRVVVRHAKGRNIARKRLLVRLYIARTFKSQPRLCITWRKSRSFTNIFSDNNSLSKPLNSLVNNYICGRSNQRNSIITSFRVIFARNGRKKFRLFSKTSWQTSCNFGYFYIQSITQPIKKKRCCSAISYGSIRLRSRKSNRNFSVIYSISNEVSKFFARKLCQHSGLFNRFFAELSQKTRSLSIR